MSWNVWPTSRLEATRFSVPFAAAYTPMKPLQNMLSLPYEPICCQPPCRAVLNPYCRIDFHTKTWTCPFCAKANHFPPHYAQNITESQLPGEVIQGYTTVEYQLPTRHVAPQVYLFVVDTVMILDELEALKQSLIVALSLIPEDALVGLVSFGASVTLYELAHTDFVKGHIIKGNKPVTGQTLQELLGVFGRKRGQGSSQSPAMRFLLPRAECEYHMSTILEELEPDAWPVQTGRRPMRCTGAALGAATALLELAAAQSASRLMLFTGGPCTVGDGAVATLSLEDRMRQHVELQKGTAPLFAPADKYYEGIARRLVKIGHTCDLFACALDQLGLLEMRHLVEKTGGQLVNHEGFRGGVQGDVFTKTLLTMFERDAEGNLPMGFKPSLEVKCSREYKVCGAIGPVVSKNEKGSQISELEIGIGNTKAWSLSCLDQQTTVGLYFEIVNQGNAPIKDGRQLYLQILTHYKHPSLGQRLRVTTAARAWADSSNVDALSQGFDQEAAAVLTARYVAFRAQSEEVFDIMRWMDRMLIRLSAKFGTYRKDDPSSFHLSSHFSIFPQFMFHLRRSQFLQVPNSSPDETVYFRYHLLRQTVAHGLLMIQPTLICYSLSGPPTPVLLDNTSMQPDRILMLDSFFWVTLWVGETIAAWRNEGYHEMEGYENVKALLLEPKANMADITKDRTPVPRVIETDQHKSQARFLLAKLNPAVTHMNASTGYGSGAGAANELVYTDDVSLQVFLQHLAKLAVQGQ